MQRKWLRCIFWVSLNKQIKETCSTAVVLTLLDFLICNQAVWTAWHESLSVRIPNQKSSTFPHWFISNRFFIYWQIIWSLSAWGRVKQALGEEVRMVMFVDHQSACLIIIKASVHWVCRGTEMMGTATQREKSAEGKVALKLAGEGHKVMVFLGIRKHTARSCFNVTLPSWMKHCEWCCTRRSSRHTECASPQRDNLRLVGEKLKFNII